MARTPEQIEQIILDSKDAETSLSVFNSPSKVSKWRSWVRVFRDALFIQESLWDQKKKEIQAIADTVPNINEKWYADQVLGFQYGYSLIEMGGRLVYLIQDDAAKIVKKVAVVSQSGVVIFKVAKSSGSTLVKLTAAEKVALDSFINDIVVPGTVYLLVSEDPDLVKVKTKIWYDGKLDLAAFKASVEAAINTYLTDIYFNGFFNVNKYRDAIEAVDGVEDTLVESIEMKAHDSSSYLSVQREYSSPAGYYKIDPAFPLSNPAQIEYIPR